MIAGPICAKGKPRQAARLLAASEAQIEIMGASIKPQDKFEIDRFEEAVRKQLGETEFIRAWAEGRALSFDDAVAYALEEDFAS